MRKTRVNFKNVSDRVFIGRKVGRSDASIEATSKGSGKEEGGYRKCLGRKRGGLYIEGGRGWVRKGRVHSSWGHSQRAWGREEEMVGGWAASTEVGEARGGVFLA